MICVWDFFETSHGRQRQTCRVTLVLSMALMGLAGCVKPSGSEPGTARLLSQRGIASWYGPGFHGKKTTSGAIYDQQQLTAAHQTLPLGSNVRVTNLSNRKSVDVLINDRGPFAKGRIIDLSYAAAERVEMIGPGTAPVLVELIDDNGHGLTAIPDRLDYTVQVGSFADVANAQGLKRQLEGLYGSDVTIQNHAGFHRVHYGTFDSYVEAKAHAENLARAGFNPVVVEKTLQKR